MKHTLGSEEAGKWVQVSKERPRPPPLDEEEGENGARRDSMRDGEEEEDDLCPLGEGGVAPESSSPLFSEKHLRQEPGLGNKYCMILKCLRHIGKDLELTVWSQ